MASVPAPTPSAVSAGQVVKLWRPRAGYPTQVRSKNKGRARPRELIEIKLYQYVVREIMDMERGGKRPDNTPPDDVISTTPIQNTIPQFAPQCRDATGRGVMTDPVFPRDQAVVEAAAFDSGTCRVCGLGPAKKCAACNVARYCSREHQTLDWKDHKEDCAEMSLLPPLLPHLPRPEGGRSWKARAWPRNATDTEWSVVEVKDNDVLFVPKAQRELVMNAQGMTLVSNPTDCLVVRNPFLPDNDMERHDYIVGDYDSLRVNMCVASLVADKMYPAAAARAQELGWTIRGRHDCGVPPPKALDIVPLTDYTLDPAIAEPRMRSGLWYKVTARYGDTERFLGVNTPAVGLLFTAMAVMESGGGRCANCGDFIGEGKFHLSGNPTPGGTTAKCQGCKG